MLDLKRISNLFNLHRQKYARIDGDNKRENYKVTDYDYHEEIVRKMEVPNE